MFGHEGMGAEGGAKGSGPDYAPTVQSGRAAGSRVQRRDPARRCVLGRLGGKRPTHRTAALSAVRQRRTPRGESHYPPGCKN